MLGQMFGRATLQAHNVATLEDRVDILRQQVFNVRGGLRDPIMRRLGLLATRQCRARADSCELEAIYWFTANNVRYTGDIAGKDTYQTALRTLQYGGGDCDDHGILNAVLAMENGFTCHWRITSNTGGSWDHIYCMAGVPKHKPVEWIALDTTLTGGRIGREPRFVKYKDFLVAPGG
jgi:transglutaminase superfamily protein